MDRSKLENLLAVQKKAFQEAPPAYQKRMDSLKKLSEIIEMNAEKLIQAVSEDFGMRAAEETQVLEIFPLQDQIRHAMKNLKTWMKKQSVPSSWFLLPSSAYYQFQPLGSVGIMGAWNYQVQLSLSPLVDALAAGNHAIIKPSEISPRSAAVIKEMINSSFPREYVHCITGDATVARDFSGLAFDHLFFTGSSATGKKVMAAAANNLTPVTLELGGKSPAIIHESFSLKLAVKRILVGKLFNCGQTCVAPDYVIIPAKLNDEFINIARDTVARLYPEIETNQQYSDIISEKQYARLEALLEDARDKGAHIIELGNWADSPKRMFPKIVLNTNPEMALMQEEIFGPVLPVVNLETFKQAVSYVNEKPKPLALYYFDNNKKRVEWLLKNTLSGGVTINDTVYHLGQHNLPFGGVGNSGMGHYHGYDGFVTFSKKRAVMHQRRLAATDFFHPPYTPFKKKLIKIMSRLSKV